MSNIEKVQKMVKGIYNRPIQVGYHGKSIGERKEGETWVDHNNRTWVKEDGKRKQITKIPPRGFDKCSVCENLILKTLDKQTYDRFQKCRVCQMEFEAELHRKDEWNGWVTEMEEKRWESFLGEYEEEMKLLEEDKTLRFDKSVANALANNEIKK
jgi:transcription elongation factor Elf1